MTGSDTTATEIGVIEAIFSMCWTSMAIARRSSTPTELQGQQASAVIGEMRDSLIDNWA